MEQTNKFGIGMEEKTHYCSIIFLKPTKFFPLPTHNH